MYPALVTYASAIVPEPATWAMLIAGLAFVGLALRQSAKRARRRFYINCGLTEQEVTAALRLRSGALSSHVDQLKLQRAIAPPQSQSATDTEQA